MVSNERRVRGMKKRTWGEGGEDGEGSTQANLVKRSSTSILEVGNVPV